MKAKDLHAKSKEQLQSQLLELKKELLKLQSKAAVGSVEKPGKMRQTKKSIAQIMTIVHQRSLHQPQQGVTPS